MYIAQNLKYLRERKGETQKDISSLLNVSEMTISRYENGENEPDLKNVVVLANHFDVSLDEIISVKMNEEIPLYLKNLRYLRTRFDMKQKDIANLLGVSQKSISKYEKCERTPTIENVIKLADYFGFTLDQFVKQDLSEVER